MATELSPNKKRMREDEKSEYEKLSASDKWAAKENGRLDNIQSDFFRVVKTKLEDALDALEEAEKEVFEEYYKWKARELRNK
ncbi:MAG: hypothetical protein SFW07_02925 [Gammaproteobacteria bacterium]|nr:hypothetical protein [Gammaproteobacteria bacterium]